MKKKQKKNPSRGRRTLKRPQRLLLAKDWVPTYTGKKIVAAYAKKFGTDLPTAIAELRILGVAISAAYEAAVLTTLAAIAAKRKEKKEAASNTHLTGVEQDDSFAYIVGYTSGGAPYGLRWDELTPEERKQFTKT